MVMHVVWKQNTIQNNLLSEEICLFLHNGYIELVVHDVGLFLCVEVGYSGLNPRPCTHIPAANPVVRNFSKIDRNLLIQEHLSIF